MNKKSNQNLLMVGAIVVVGIIVLLGSGYFTGGIQPKASELDQPPWVVNQTEDCNYCRNSQYAKLSFYGKVLSNQTGDCTLICSVELYGRWRCKDTSSGQVVVGDCQDGPYTPPAVLACYGSYVTHVGRTFYYIEDPSCGPPVEAPRPGN